jgi:acyl-CoA synthetase (NDP forming)
MEAVIQDPGVDGLAIQLPPMAHRIPKEFFRVFQRAVDVRKPIALWLAGVESGRYEPLEWVEEMNVPVFSTPEKAIRALSALHRLSRGG